jgi:RHS repeat-associated protein
MPLKSNVKCVATKSSNGSSDTTYLFTDALGSPVASMGTIAATVSYSCPAGWALSGNTCTQSSSSSFPASVTGYTCPSGYTLSGSTCTRTTTSTSAATVTYSCPAGYAVSGSSCTGSSSYAASGSLSCNGYGSLQAYANSSSGYKCITQNIFTADYPDGPKAQCQAIAASMGLPLVGSPIVNNGKIMQCVMGPKTVYACPSGGTLSGSTCTTTSSTAATANYSCPAGQSLSGSTCTASSTSSTPGAPVYSCPSGATLSGSNCTSTGSSTTAATAGFSCPSGGTLSGSNCTGAVSRTRYEAYGGTAGGVAPNTLGFTGHVNDAGTGLVYMQQRYYDPIAGRFLSLDPVTTDANTGKSFGRYHYASNNPYAHVDPDGRDWVPFWSYTYIAGNTPSASAVSSAMNAADNTVTGGFGRLGTQAMSNGNFWTGAGYYLAGTGHGLLLTYTLAEAATYRIALQATSSLVSSVAAKGATQALSVEGTALLTANPVGSALKADPAHRMATFMREEAAATGTNFAIVGGDGVTRTLTQVSGSFNGVRGRYEYIVDSLNNLTHQMFVRGGSINGIPIKP